jgi:hypothetical protein
MFGLEYSKGYWHVLQWLRCRFGLVIGFIGYLQVVTTINYNTVPDFHTTKHSTLFSSVYLHWSSRIYNTGTIKVSLNHTFPISLCYSIHMGHAIAQAISRWLPTAAARGSSPGLVMWDLWWTKWHWGRFPPRTSVSPANFHSTNCSTITLINHLGLV